MKITDIETHLIYPPLHPWNADAIGRYQGSHFRCRSVFVFHTDNGLEGLGEFVDERGAALAEEWAPQLIGTNPAEWLGHPSLPIWLAPAIYDLVGKYNQVPAYHLFGPKVRSRVPVSAWTVSQTPAKMAETLTHAVEAGHTWLKYHTSHFHNIVAQTEAMQEVAPPGFKVHYDLNWDSTVQHIMELARALEKYPVAGAFEDALRPDDVDGYRLLRQKCPLPLYVHHGQDVIGVADGHMLGHADVGHTIRKAGLFEEYHLPFMTQNVGGNIVLAFVAHMSAAFRMGTLHHVTGADLWAEDVVTPMLEVAGGTVPVPEAPGLGVTLDRDALARWSEPQPDPLPRILARIQYDRLPTIYVRAPAHDWMDRLGTGPSFMDGHGPGYNHPVDMDYWDDDDSAEFADMWERTAAGPVNVTSKG